MTKATIHLAYWFLGELKFSLLWGKNLGMRPSLVVQWLRILLSMQGTRVRALVQEDPTCHGATKPVHHNYWACVLQLLKPAHLEPLLCNEKPPQWEARTPQQRVAPLLTATRESPRTATKTQCSSPPQKNHLGMRLLGHTVRICLTL